MAASWCDSLLWQSEVKRNRKGSGRVCSGECKRPENLFTDRVSIDLHEAIIRMTISGLMASLKAYSMNWERVQFYGPQPNTISLIYQCSVHKICSNIVISLLHFLASDFIIVVELTLKSHFQCLQKHTENGFILSGLCYCSPSFSVNAFYLKEKLPPFHIRHILWFRECWSLLSSLPALCQEPRNFFSLLHAPKQYYSRLSFKRPKRTGRKGCR